MEDEQRRVCAEWGAEFVASPAGCKLGLARDFDPEAQPINGLRHPASEGVSGWYIWAGEELASDPDYFEPVHVSHFEAAYPQLAKYLGLAPGWRFLVAQEHEDLWYDGQLLQV